MDFGGVLGLERLLNAPEWIIVAGAVVAALSVIWRKVVLPVRDFIQRVKRFMDRTETAVSWVEEQMKPNGGSSLVDKVNMLLAHDAERDVVGRRYGTEDES